MLKRLLSICLILLLSGMTGCNAIPTVNSGSIEVGNENMRVSVAFNDHDRKKIKNYYKHSRKAKKSKKMPPGLAKREKLPPGLQKHIEKHGQLPPGLHKRSLPVDLERELSPLPKGYVRVKVGGDVVLVDEKTRVVVDVIWDVG
jgi:Ni/Co efflux regulator RcnB